MRVFGRHLAAAVGLVGLIAVVYGDSLNHAFVFDDWELVVGNDLVTWPLSRAFDLFELPGGGVSYRPVRVISYMVDYRIGDGLDPRVFHASNLVYHAAATLVLYVLAFRTLGALGGALLAAALFAVHPLGSEAVAYVAGRRDLLAGLFSLLGLLSWWIFCEAAALRSTVSLVVRRAAALLGTLGAAALALGAKENAAVFPALALLLYVVHARRSGARIGSRAAWVGLAVGAVALCVVVDQIYLERVYEALSRLRGPPLAPQPALTASVFGRYAWLSVWPVHLYADYRPPAWPLPTASLDWYSAASGVALLASLVSGIWLLWRGRIAGLGLLWFPIALLPVLQVVPYGEVVAEHNAYLAMAGLALAAGDVATSWAHRRPRALLVAGVVVIALLAVRTHARTADWRDDEALWTVTLKERPASVRARHNLAVALAERGRLEQARGLLREAADLAPDQMEVLSTLATVEGRLGNDAAALAVAKHAVEVRPDAESWTFLGFVQLAAGSEAAARRSFQRALRIDRRFGEARRGLAEIRQRERQRRHLRQGRSR